MSSSVSPLLFLPSIFPSIRVFSSESTLCIRWPKYWSFSFRVSPSNEHPGLISIRMGLVGSPCSPRNSQEFSPTPQFENIHSLALSLHYGPALNLYMTTGKIIALTTQTFVGKVMSLLFNTLSRFVIAFLPRSRCLLILWLQSPSAVISEPKKIKSVTASTFSPSICHDMMIPTRCHDLSFLNVEFQATFFTLLFHTHQEAL